jgi:hypothetical protein
MNKKITVAVVVVLLASVAFVAYYITIDRRYGYHFSMFRHSIPCSQLFTPLALSGVDPFLVSGRMRKTDQIYTYVYKRAYYVLIWRIDALKNLDLAKVPIDTNVYLDNVELRGVILDAGDPRETEVRYGPFFKDSLVVDLDEYSKISKTFQTPNYRGFYGDVGKIAFENGKRQILAMENYTQRITPTLFLMYKAHDGFFMIIINSKKPFGLEMLKILNLK